MTNTYCIYISEANSKKIDFSGFENLIFFPDSGKTQDELMKFPRIEGSTLVVCSPIICTNYKFGEVYVYNDDSLELLDESIYGASLDIAIKTLHKDVRSLLSSYIIEEIRSRLKTNDALKYVESLADSMERAYLLKQLEKY